MRILLDLDDTVIIRGNLHPQFARFQDWAKKGGHHVIVWSCHDDGQVIAQLMGFDYRDKESHVKPIADVLIDDHCQEFEKLCTVNSTCSTLDGFLKLVKNGV